RRHILNLMCNLETSWEDDKMKFNGIDNVKSMLKGMEDDDLIIIKENGIEVKEEGRPYVRNVCMSFDLRMLENEPETRLFSMTI
ncbi:MAG TPA: coproporphyrinogen III oxidase, partial [Faecalibacter sp.]